MKGGLLLSLLAASLGAEALRIGDKVPEIRIDPQVFDVGKAPATVVVFTSIVCPIANDYLGRMNAMQSEFGPKGIQFAFVNANANETAVQIEEHAKANKLEFQVHRDGNQRLADRLGAQFTPETFVFDRAGSLVYHGYIDDARNEARVQVHGLRDGLNAVLSGKPIAAPETKAFGCTIKRARRAS